MEEVDIGAVIDIAELKKLKIKYWKRDTPVRGKPIHTREPWKVSGIEVLDVMEDVG